MKKRIFALLLAAVLLLSAGCAVKPEHTKYSSSFFDTFDTVITVYGYAPSQADFDAFAAKVHERFTELNALFDAYGDYEGIVNVKALNDAAGKAPLRVSPELFSLLSLSREWYDKTGGKVNVAMGGVTGIWKKCRDAAVENAAAAALPSEKELGMAREHTRITDLILDEEKKTVYLADPYMSIDVGAVAKGYAARLVTEEMTAQGYDHFVINAGGNVVVKGNDMGKNAPWEIGIQDPGGDSANSLIDSVRVTDKAVVTAGSYQRYFTVNGVRYHHIIDPLTAMPAPYFDSVTVLADDSFIADFLSTSLFILPYEQGARLVAETEGVEAFWVEVDGTVHYSDGYPEYSSVYSTLLG